MSAGRTARSRAWATTAVMGIALTVTACGDDGDPDIGGAAAPDEAVTDDLTVSALQLAYPEDGLHEEGSDVLLYAALTNSGTSDYRLVDVVGPDFADATLLALDGGEGAVEVPANDNAYLEPEGAPSVLLEDLDTSLRSSQSVEVTFVFEDAEGDLGEVTLEAPVAASPPGQGGFEAPQDPSSDT